MNILVLVKSVADLTQNLQVDDQGNFVNSELETVLNPYDKHALEAGLQLAGTEGTVTAMSFGTDSKSTEKTLREALSLGIQQAILVQSPLLVAEQENPFKIGFVLAEAIASLDPFDLILTGNESADENQGYTSVLVADLLNLPYLDYVNQLTQQGDTLTYQSVLDAGRLKGILQGPAVISVMDSINKPRLPSFKNKMASKKAIIQEIQVTQWTLVEEEFIARQDQQIVASGLMPMPVKEKQVVFFDATEAEDAPTQMVNQLRQDGVLS